MNKYQTEEERQEARRKSRKKWKDAHKEYDSLYYENNKNSILDYHKEYGKTQMGRAQSQRGQYKRMDIRNGFGNVIDFDARWIVDNIYTKSCAYCGETDWHKLGCNRKDNNKPHTKDNVEPCCFKCNVKLAAEDFSKKKSTPLDQIDSITGEVLRTFKNTSECIMNGFTHTDAVARGDRKTDKGYIFKRHTKQQRE